MNDKLNKMADDLTDDIMSFVYGERYDNTDDITEDEELSKAWEYINEKAFGYLWATYDEGYDEGCNDTEDNN